MGLGGARDAQPTDLGDTGEPRPMDLGGARETCPGDPDELNRQSHRPQACQSEPSKVAFRP